MEVALVAQGVLPAVGWEPAVLIAGVTFWVAAQGIAVDANIKLVAAGIDEVKVGLTIDGKAFLAGGDRIAAANTAQRAAGILQAFIQRLEQFV